jgi:proteic killer suppression protein
VLIEFAKKELGDLYILGKDAKGKYPAAIIERYVKRIDYIKAAESFNDLYAMKSVKFEKLKGISKYSVRINDRYRIEMIYGLSKDKTMVMKVFIIMDISSHYRGT